MMISSNNPAATPTSTNSKPIVAPKPKISVPLKDKDTHTVTSGTPVSFKSVKSNEPSNVIVHRSNSVADRRKMFEALMKTDPPAPIKSTQPPIKRSPWRPPIAPSNNKQDLQETESNKKPPTTLPENKSVKNLASRFIAAPILPPLNNVNNSKPQYQKTLDSTPNSHSTPQSTDSDISHTSIGESPLSSDAIQPLGNSDKVENASPANQTNCVEIHKESDNENSSEGKMKPSAIHVNGKEEKPHLPASQSSVIPISVEVKENLSSIEIDKQNNLIESHNESSSEDKSESPLSETKVKELEPPHSADAKGKVMKLISSESLESILTILNKRLQNPKGSFTERSSEGSISFDEPPTPTRGLDLILKERIGRAPRRRKPNVHDVLQPQQIDDQVFFN